MIDDGMRVRIAALAAALGPLKDRCVLTGGAVTPFYLTDSQELAPRMTRDIDLIIDVVDRHEYLEEVDRYLRAQGFSQGGEDGDPLCRWRIDTLICDIMPKVPTILGFRNPWYGPGHALAYEVEITQQCRWLLMPVVYFVASKLEAFWSRGRLDPEASQDMEDLIAVINGHPELADEVVVAADDVRVAIARHISDMLLSDDIMQAVSAHLLPDRASQQRLPLIQQRMRLLARLCNPSARSQ